MSRSVGVIGITPNGKYLYEGSAAGHLGPKPYFTVVEDIDKATLFVNLPNQIEHVVTAVPAYVERLVRIGVCEELHEPN